MKLILLFLVDKWSDVSYGRYHNGTDNWHSHGLTSLENANDFYE